MKIKSYQTFYVSFTVFLMLIIISPVFVIVALQTLNEDYYKYQEKDSAEIEVYNLSKEPLVTDEVIRDFIKSAVVNTISFEINDLENQENRAKKFYSDEGWLSVWPNIRSNQMDLMINSGVIRIVAVVNENPLMLGYREAMGKKFWRFYLAGNYQAIGKGGSQNQSFTVIAELSQQASSENIRGIAIDSLDIK